MEDECEWLLSYDRHRERKMTDLLYDILYGEWYLKKKLKKLKLDATTYYLKRMESVLQVSKLCRTYY